MRRATGIAGAVRSTDGTELINRVDARDHVLGAIERGAVLEAGVNFRTAHVLIRDTLGRVLLQRLAPSRKRHAGRWGSSVAAYVRAGETYEDAARRRMKEELCLCLPLESAAKLSMQDRRSLKFVAVFTAIAEDAEICEPHHIAELRFWEPKDLAATVRSDPERFTPTFQRVREVVMS